jgi:hypothetical protein
MNKLFAVTALLALNSTSLLPSATAQVPVASDHQPNKHTMICLEAPTRDCALNAAIQTVVAEEFGIERAKILIGVARSLIETGKYDDAKETLTVALEEARSVRLSLVTQEKITEIAPLRARAGDVAGALALAQELQNDSIKDLVLFQIAEEAANKGAIADARVALRQTQNQNRAFWRELSLLTRASSEALTALNVTELETKVRALERPDMKYRGLIRLAIIADRMSRPGDRNALISEADEMFPSLVGIHPRANATADRARSMYDAGMDDAFVSASYDLAILHGDRLRGIEPQADFANKVGAVEAGNDNLEGALKRLDFFSNIDDKARYLASLRSERDRSILSAEIRDVMQDVTTIEGAYERDLVRLTLLEGALGNADLSLVRTIVEAMEDDDNQAFALALMAQLLD